MAQLSGVPTIAESGIAGYEAVAWHGLAAPAGTSSEIVDKLQAAVEKILADPETTQQLEAIGTVPISSTTQAFQKHIAAEIDKWSEVVKASDATVN